MPLSVGYAQTVISPILDRPVYLAGFGQDRRAETIHDDLTARALALKDEQTTLVLVALDLIGFFRLHALDVIRRVNERAPGVQVIVASIHTHHGPDTIGLWGPDLKTSGVDPSYVAEVKDKIVAIILQALEKTRPARFKAASRSVPGLAKNARNPEVVDDELMAAQFVGQDGKPLASLFDFPCHPEVLWEHNPHITADYPGVLRREVEAASGAPCLFFAGALGGMMTPDVRDHSFEEAEHMGKTLAMAGLEALDSAQSSQPEAVSIQKLEVDVKLTNILYKLAFRRKLLPDARNRRGEVTTEVNLVKLDDLWLATVPGELLPKLGLALKADLREAGAREAGILGLANDELGYILPREDFRFPLNPFRPGKHYEETNSVSKNIGPILVAAFRQLLQPGSS
jgi:hypothetical protein